MNFAYFFQCPMGEIELCLMLNKKTAKWSIALIFSYLFNYISMHNILKNYKKSTVNQFPPQKGLAASFMIEALQRFVM